jgi:hypothetical protein
VRVRLRASGFEEQYRRMAVEMGLLDIVTFAPPLPYGEALREMQQASALLLFQSRVCNEQIPAKAYEYLYAGRPIIGLADPEGDTGRLLLRFGVSGIAPLEDEDSIARMLEACLPQVRRGVYAIPPRASVMAVSRRAGAQQLAGLLNQVVAEAARSASRV